MSASLRRVLSVRPDESRLVYGLASHAILLTAAAVIAEAAQISIFLTHFGRTYLPYAYLATAALGAGVALVCTSLNAGYGFRRVMRGSLLATALVVPAVAYLSFVPALSAAAAFLVFPVSRVALSLVIGQTRGLATEVLDPHQARRLLPLIAAGAELSRIMGGVAVYTLIYVIGGQHLLAAAGLLALPAVGLLSRIPGSAATPQTTLQRTTRQWLRDSQKGCRILLSSRVLRMAALFVCAMTLAAALVEFQYQILLKRTFAGDQLAVVQGGVSAAAGALAFVLQLGVVRRLLPVLGIGVFALSRPMTVGACAAATCLSPTFAPVAAIWVAEHVMEGSGSQPALHQVYASVPFARRIPAMTFIDGVVAPLVWVLSACALALLPLSVGIRALAGGLLIVCVAGVVVARKLKPAYRESLRQALQARTLSIDELPLGGQQFLEPSLRPTLLAALHSEQPAEVVFALELIRTMRGEELRDEVAPLVHDSRSSVAVAAVDTLATWGEADDIRALADILTPATRPATLVAALRALRDLRHREILPRLDQLRRHPDDGVRDEAALAFEMLSVDAASDADRVAAMARAPDALRRRAAALLLPRVRPSRAEPLVTALLNDADMEVRCAAAVAAASIQGAAVREALLNMVCEPELQRLCADALAAHGDAAIPAIVERIQSAGAPREARMLLPRVLARIGSERALDALLDCASLPETSVRKAALHSLLRLRRRGMAPPRRRMLAWLQFECRESFRCQRTLSLLRAEGGGETAATRLLTEELRRRQMATVDRIFNILALLYPAHTVYTARAHLLSRAATRRGLALSLLNEILRPREAAWIIPVIEGDASPRRLRTAHAVLMADEPEQLGDLLNTWRDPWLRQCAAVWLRGPETPEVEDFMQMLEKVLFLRRVPILEGLEGEDLQPLAAVMEERHFHRDETVFQEGELGDSLWIIVRGGVTIQRAGRRVADLGEGECFGEMSLLEDRPRSASAVANEETDLLRLHRMDFQVLVERHPSLAQNVMAVLSARLRSLLETLDPSPAADADTPDRSA